MQAMDVERGPLSRGFEGGVKIRVRVEMAQDHAVRDPPRSRRATVPEAGVDGSRTVHADVLREIVERGRVHLAGDDLRWLPVDGDGEGGGRPASSPTSGVADRCQAPRSRSRGLESGRTGRATARGPQTPARFTGGGSQNKDRAHKL